MENEENKSQEDTQEIKFEVICEVCGRKFITTDFFQTACKQCINEYANFISKND